MMESGIPMPGGGVIAAEGKVEVGVGIVPDEGALHLNHVPGRLSVEGDFAEVADLSRQRRRELQIKLAKIESTQSPLLICGGEIDVAKPSDCQRRVMGLSLLNDRLLRGTLGGLGALYSRRRLVSGRIFGWAGGWGGPQ